MVQKFCDDEDDAAALRLAQHLSRPVFDGYSFQKRAKELAAQLIRKDGEDVRLPLLPVWWLMQLFLTRDEQMVYLAKRLKQLHTSQMSQPGDVYYDSIIPFNWISVVCINPYLELKRMRLVNHDFVALAPYAADDDFMRTYSYWRSWHPVWELHRVSWAIRNLVNESVSMNESAGKKNNILSEANDGSVYFTANSKGDVVEQLRKWAQAQPPRGFWVTWWQTPTALLISYLVFLRYRYLCAHPKPPRRSLLSRWRQKKTE